MIGRLYFGRVVLTTTSEPASAFARAIRFSTFNCVASMATRPRRALGKLICEEQFREARRSSLRAGQPLRERVPGPGRLATLRAIVAAVRPAPSRVDPSARAQGP